jgi:hypothetical protein
MFTKDFLEKVCCFLTAPEGFLEGLKEEFVI